MYTKYHKLLRTDVVIMLMSISLKQGFLVFSGVESGFGFFLSEPDPGQLVK